MRLAVTHRQGNGPPFSSHLCGNTVVDRVFNRRVGAIHPPEKAEMTTQHEAYYYCPRQSGFSQDDTQTPANDPKEGTIYTSGIFIAPNSFCRF